MFCRADAAARCSLETECWGDHQLAKHTVDSRSSFHLLAQRQAAYEVEFVLAAFLQ